MKNEELHIKTIELGPLQTNCYIVVDPNLKKAVVVDPGDEGGRIWRMIQEEGWILEKILITHGHYDHIGGVASLKKASGAEVWIHEIDSEMLENPEKNFSFFMGSSYACQCDGFLKENQTIPVGSSELRVLHTPGHTQGSVSFLGNGFVIVGDTLFNNSVGRTDFPGSSGSVLLDSIRNKLLVLDDTTMVYPGHGPSTTIGDERKGNPFLVGDQPYI